MNIKIIDTLQSQEMNSSYILKVFNDQFDCFMNDLLRVFPEDVDILSTKRTFQLLRRANPKILVQGWKHFVNDKYKEMLSFEKIGSENNKQIIEFFTTKSYDADLENNPNKHLIISGINRLRKPIAEEMNAEDQTKVLKYLSNLSTLCDLYIPQ